MKLITLLTTFVAAFSAVAAPVQPVPLKVPAKIPDVLQPLQPMDVLLGGYLGERAKANTRGRLVVVDEDELLAGFRNRPGKQAWCGEHVGKFLHAATLAWANTGDEQLKPKIDRVAAELIKCQDADGYLGTYLPKDHWTSWDVWVHKYNLIGLLTYYQYTGNPAALDCCRKMGDLLIATFPAKMSIIKAGTHVGMAATSVLEPIVLLYRLTGDERYLNFAKYIVLAYDDPGGPAVVTTLLEQKSVRKTANGKAYEMMSNLVGLCELARVTGEMKYIDAAANAWEDVVAHQLYITGASSHGEHFGEDNQLPNESRAKVGETCVTTTWIQLSSQLLRLTGEAKYGDELERAYYNHLAGAQLPDGSKWCYYTSLVGTKPYGNSTNCCLSSGPRAMAMARMMACFRYDQNGEKGVAINLLDTWTACLWTDGVPVMLDMESSFPSAGSAALRFRQIARDITFSLKIRCPEWAAPMTIDGEKVAAKDGWVTVPARKWKEGDRISIAFNIAPRLIVGDHGNKGCNALAYGPLVLADIDKPNPAAFALVEGLEGAALTVKRAQRAGLFFEAAVKAAPDAPPLRGTFVPFAEAGADGGKFQVWMPTVNRPISTSLLFGGYESRSRQGNLDGSIIDGDVDSAAVTFDGRRADEDWFAVTVEKPIAFKRIVFAHGRSFHDGGWFDASAGKPRIQIQKAKGGPWETIGTLDDYPATTATQKKGLKDGQEFTLRLPAPVQAVALRVIGKPACGDNPKQAFSSCGELQAFAE